MKLSSIPTFRTEDFPGQQEWISRLFIQLNPFVQSLNQVLNLNIDFSSNVRSVTLSYDIEVFQEFQFMWPFPDVAVPVDCRVMSALKGTAQTPAILLCAWQYSKSTGQITISDLVEVSSSGNSEISERFQFTIRASV